VKLPPDEELAPVILLKNSYSLVKEVKLPPEQELTPVVLLR
jgi:hypothetical protein